ncbi:MAG: hypothetical protein ACUVS3_09330 [Thermodesulfobacteriota bacterium]
MARTGACLSEYFWAIPDLGAAGLSTLETFGGMELRWEGAGEDSGISGALDWEW